MKQLAKKALPLLLIASLALSMTGCGGGSSTSSGGSGSSFGNGSSSGTPNSAESKEPIELTAFAMEGPYTKGDFNDLALWKITEEKTGIKVNFESAPNASFTEKLGLKFASNQLPDMFFKCPMGNADITKYASEGALVPVDEYLSEYAPNFSSYLADDSSIEKNLKMADGHIYGFPYLVTAAPSRIAVKMFANEKWLEAQGLSLPTTTDELYETLVKMKSYDYNGNGQADDIPLVAESKDSLFNSLMGSFGLMTRGAAQRIWDIDPATGGLRFIQTSDNYKEFLQFLNKLYTEKLLDQEVFTMDLAQVSAKAAQNIIGFAFINNTNYLGDIASDFTYLPGALKGPNGDQNYASRTVPFAGQNTFITSVNEHPAETVQWIDWFYSQEGITAYFMGVEGETYEMVDGVPKFTDYVVKNPDGLNMEEALGTYVCWSGGGNPSVADDLHFGNHLIPELTVKAAEAVKPYTPEEIWSGFVYTAEDTERLAVLQADIDTYLSDMTAKFITGEVGFDQWDSYKAQIDKMGLEEYREITQRALDTYNAQ